MRRALDCLIVLSLGACSGSGSPSEAASRAETQRTPVVLVSNKAAKSVAWYTLGGELLEEVPVGDHPHEIVLAPDGSRLYVTDNGVMRIENAGEGGNSVTIIDVANRARIGEIDLGRWHRPHGIDLCPDGTLLVTTENPDQLLVIDAATRAIVGEHETGGETPHIVRCSRDSTEAFVSNARSGTVAKVELGSGEISVLETGSRPEGSALSKDGRTLYVAHREASKIVILDTESWRVLGEIPTGSQPVRCGLTGDEKTIVYGLSAGRAVGFADVESRTEVGQIALAGPAVSLEMQEDGETALACVQVEDTCHVISVPERRIAYTVKLKPGSGPDPALLLGSRSSPLGPARR